MNEATKDMIVYIIAGLAILLAFLFLPTAIVFIGLFLIGLVVIPSFLGEELPNWIAVVMVAIVFVFGSVFVLSVQNHIGELTGSETVANFVALAYILLFCLLIARMVKHEKRKKK